MQYIDLSTYENYYDKEIQFDQQTHTHTHGWLNEKLKLHTPNFKHTSIR